MAVVLVAAACLSACDDAGSGGKGAAAPRGPTLRERARELAEAFGGDKGSNADRDRLLELLAEAQRAFRAGNGRGVCATMDSEALEEWRSMRECARKVESVAAAVESGALELPAPEVMWVRVYDRVGGITMLNPNGDDHRLPFAKRNGRWGAHFFLDARPEVLNVRLP